MMGEKMPASSFLRCSPSASPHRSAPVPLDRERYLSELIGERQKLGPFTQVLPMCSMLLNQEIRKLSGFSSNYAERERLELNSPQRFLNQYPNGRPVELEGWAMMRPGENGHFRRMDPFLAPPGVSWPGAPGVPAISFARRVVRLDVPVDKYPNFNFVGRLLGPRGNSLKRVEALTECRVYIRGHGSIKDTEKEEKLKDKIGFEHLNEPLHVLVEAELPQDIINSRLEHAIAIIENLLTPVDESQDLYKKQQLRELALLKGIITEESPSMSPSMSPGMSPFNSGEMKRVQIGI